MALYCITAIRLKMNVTRLQLVFLLAKFSSFFGLVPWLNHHRHAMHVNLFKCYSITLTILITLLSLHLYILRLKVFHTDVISDTLDVLEEVGGVGLFAVSSLGSAFWNRSKWEEFFSLIHHVESEFKKYTIQKKRNDLPKSTIILFIFSITDFCLLLTNDIISTGFPPLYGSLDVFVFTFILMINITYNTVIYIQGKFEEINYFLLRFESVNCNLPRAIERIRALYVAWHQIVESFNDLFGWPLLFIHLYYFGLLENYLVYLTDIFLKKNEPQVFAVIANSLSISIWTVSNTRLISRFDFCSYIVFRSLWDF